MTNCLQCDKEIYPNYKKYNENIECPHCGNKMVILFDTSWDGVNEHYHWDLVNFNEEN